MDSRGKAEFQSRVMQGRRIGELMKALVNKMYLRVTSYKIKF